MPIHTKWGYAEFLEHISNGFIVYAINIRAVECGRNEAVHSKRNTACSLILGKLLGHAAKR